jgi:hypothetical protein
MSYIDRTTLEAFVSDSSFLTKDTEPAGLGEAIAQADEIIFQKTRITIPDDPSESNAMIRNIACALVVWFTSGMQGKLDEFELSRRKKQYDDAMTQLDAIASGRESIIDSAGTVVSAVPQTYFSSTQRIGSAL